MNNGFNNMNNNGYTNMNNINNNMNNNMNNNPNVMPTGQNMDPMNPGGFPQNFSGVETQSNMEAFYNDTSMTQNVVLPKKKNFVLPIILGIILLLGILFAVWFFLFREVAPKEKVFLNDNEYPLIYGNAVAYKNKYANLTGQISRITYDKKGQTIYMMTDPDNYTNEVVLYYPNKSVSFKQSDYIKTVGYIKGVLKGTSKPYLIVESVEVISYKDAVTPTLKEMDLNKTATQHDVTLMIQKIEFADSETRVFLKITNSSKKEFKFYSYSSILTQAGKQYEVQISKNSKEPSNDILPGGSTEGIIVFPKVEQSNFSLSFKGYSSDYNIKFNNFDFNITEF